IGTPDLIMVAIWRLKTAISLGVMVLPVPPNSGLGLVLTTVGLMPCLRSSARSRLALLACCSPFILVPRLSVPSQTKVSRVTPSRLGAAGLPRPLAAVLAAVRVTAIAQLPWARPPQPAFPHGSRLRARVKSSLRAGPGGPGAYRYRLQRTCAGVAGWAGVPGPSAQLSSSWQGSGMGSNPSGMPRRSMVVLAPAAWPTP